MTTKSNDIKARLTQKEADKIEELQKLLGMNKSDVLRLALRNLYIEYCGEDKNDKVFYLRNNLILEGEFIGYTKKGSYRIKDNDGKEIIVSVVKASFDKEVLEREVEEIKAKKKRKKEFEKKMNEEYYKPLIELEDTILRAMKAFIRKEISETEKNEIINECNKKINKLESKF